MGPEKNRSYVEHLYYLKLDVHYHTPHLGTFFGFNNPLGITLWPNPFPNF